jgi:hypothetical protein
MGIIIIYPNQVATVTGPLIYLLGPVEGCPDWQSEAMGMLSINPSLHIASPRGAFSATKLPSASKEAWEKAYIEKASQTGVVVFWLPRGSEESPQLPESYIAFGKAMNSSRIVFGIEEGFRQREDIVASLSLVWPGEIFSNLAEVCSEAIRLSDTA